MPHKLTFYGPCERMDVSQWARALDTASHTRVAGTLGAALATACAEPQVAANQQLGLRLLCNAFRSAPLRAWLRHQASSTALPARRVGSQRGHEFSCNQCRL